MWVDTNTQEKAQNLFDIAKIKGDVEVDPYAEPERFHVWVYSIEDIVKLYKLIPK